MAAHSLVVNNSLDQCTRNQIILSRTSLLDGSLEEGKVYLAWPAIGSRLKIFGTLAHLNALS